MIPSLLLVISLLTSGTPLCPEKSDTHGAELQPKIPQGSRIVLLGDSLAEGMAAPFRRLAKNKGYVPSISALHGTRINYWSSKIERIMVDSRPKLVIISLGTNDSGTSTPEVQRIHVKKIRNVVEKYGGKIFWLSPMKLPQRFRGQDGIRKIIQDEISPQNILSSADLKLEMIKDGVHLTGKGYEGWITLAWNRLVSEGYLSH
jgi:lysophospholipase L1-like esterase